jgi:formate--tetrahydrofolate ligase
MERQARPIPQIAQQLGIADRHLVPYGSDKAKVHLAALSSDRPPGKLVLVTAITPTSAGEGKTTTSIGLAQGLAQIGEKVCLALREPSLGPVFGVKGGATGGGKAVLTPAEDINLHFTGDFHAITSAHNLLAAMLDNHLQQGNELGLEARSIAWRRVLDMNDRALRQLVVGLGGTAQGVPRETGFDITAASEVMAVLCLAQSPEDLAARLGRILVGQDRDGKGITAADLGAVGAMRVLLKDALLPNLVQTIDGVPAFVHGGPFGNIAHGCNSILATRMALAHADWAVTEAGFGADLGAEKFHHIKCTAAGIKPAAVVLVATIRALKRHGGVPNAALATADAAAVERGLPNLEAHIENVQTLGATPVVALNRFGTDTDDEIAVVRRACERLGAHVALADHFAKGALGAEELAHAVVEMATSRPGNFQPLYDPAQTVPEKLHILATRIYGAKDVSLTKQAEKDLAQIRKLGYENLPLCVAKTQSSLSDDPTRVGRPTGFTLPVRGFVLAAGAGYVVPLVGEMLRMPGLPKVPQAVHMDLAADGSVVGLLGA